MDMRNTSCRHRKFQFFDWLCAGLLLIVFVFNIYVLWTTAHHLIDSDSASELVLAEHLNETGRILSTDWYYSTELRVVNTQLVFAPLFSLFSDWQMVRFVGSVLFEIILVASYGFLIRQAGLGFSAFCIGGALLLSPMSVKYGEVVLAHSYYVPHIAIGFLMGGLLLGVLKSMQQNRKRWMAWYAIWLLILAFTSALGGFRQVAATHASLVLLATIWMHRAHDEQRGCEAFWMMLWASIAFVAGACGLLVNTALHQVFTFLDHSDVQMSVISAEKLLFMVGDFLQLFGCQEQVLLVSKTGILSMMGAVASFYCVAHGVRSLLVRKDERSFGLKLIESMFACSMCVVVLIFTLTKFNYSAYLYFIPFFAWYIPMLASLATVTPAEKKAKQENKRFIPAWPVMRKTVACMMCAVCIVNGLVNLRSFANPEVYDSNFAMEDCEALQEICDYLIAEDYDLGYTAFWLGNALTEMSDGQIRVVNIQKKDSHEDWNYFDWLSLKTNRMLEAKKPFVLLKTDEKELEDSRLKSFTQKVQEINGCTLYIVTDLDAFRSVLEANSI